VVDKKSQDRILKILNEYLGSEVGVFLFGSRAQKKEKIFSDIDIGVVDTTIISEKKIRAAANALAGSNIPVKVDLIDFNSTPTNFKQIAMEKIIIWANPDKVKSILKN
jgi:predicted nucleotidyltransferase